MGRRIRDLQSIRTGKDALRYAEQHGATIEEGGKHKQVCTSKGKCAVPNHPGDLTPGTRHSIIKMFILIGLGIMLMYVCLVAVG